MTKEQLSLQELAHLLQAEPVGDLSYQIDSCEALHRAEPHQAACFAEDKKYRNDYLNTKAGVLILKQERHEGGELPKGCHNFLLHDAPLDAFIQLAKHFHTRRVPFSGFAGVHETAVVENSASIAASATLGPYVVVDAGAVIGQGSVVGSHASIGAGVHIGKECQIGPHAVLLPGTVVGDRVEIEAGAVLGSSGFHYRQNRLGEHEHHPHHGTVVVEDDVDIGANSTVDRAVFGTTRIKKGSKIDNLVQIAHNVEVGEHNLFAAQTGIAGSSRTGSHVILAGKVGISDHTDLEDGVVLAADSSTHRSLKRGVYAGRPAMPLREHHRIIARLKQLDELFSRVRELEKKLSVTTN